MAEREKMKKSYIVQCSSYDCTLQETDFGFTAQVLLGFWGTFRIRIQLTIPCGSHPLVAGSFVLLGTNEQLVSSASRYGSCQGLLLSSYLTLFRILDLVKGGCHGRLLVCQSLVPQLFVMPPFLICFSSLEYSPGLSLSSVSLQVGSQG